MRKCKVRKFQLWQIFVCFNDFFSCQYFWRNVFCDGTELWSKRFLAEWKNGERRFVRVVGDWLENLTSVSTEFQCTLQALPWNNRSLEVEASFAFVPKKCLESKKKRDNGPNQRFTTCFVIFFWGGGRSMGDVFWKVRILWIFDDLQNVYVFLSSQVHSSKNYLYNNTTPEVFALSSTGTSILRKPSICQLVELAEKWQLSLNAYSIRPSENFRKHSGP